MLLEGNMGAAGIVKIIKIIQGIQGRADLDDRLVNNLGKNMVKLKFHANPQIWPMSSS